MFIREPTEKLVDDIKFPYFTEWKKQKQIDTKKMNTNKGSKDHMKQSRPLTTEFTV